MTDKERRKFEMLAEDMVQSATNLREYELAHKRKRAEFIDYVRSLQDDPNATAPPPTTERED